MNTTGALNTRILVIDDEESVRDSFRTSLRTEADGETAMELAASALFGDVPPPPRRAYLAFEVHVATNGREGAAMVAAAMKKGLPYAVIFCDMRMPGWDGVETIEAIRELDQRSEVVFITAYSDHSLETIVERAGANVGYFIKPFLTDEVKQLATKLVLEWNKARELEDLMSIITSLRGETKDMERLLQHLLTQICAWLGTDSAALLRLGAGGPEFCLGVGALNSHALVADLLERVKKAAPIKGVLELPDGTTFLPIDHFGLAVAAVAKSKITPDRKFLLQVFLEHAALAIHNSEMQAELVEQQRMATVGMAAGFILHDLRGPMGVAQMVTHLLRSGKEGFRSKEAMLALLDKHLQRAIEMVRDTLAFSRSDLSLQRARVSLAATLEGMASVFRMDLDPRGIQLDMNIPPDLEAYVDVDRLERVLWNLTRNAIDAVAGTKAPRIEIGAQPVDGGIAIWVGDNGPGVSVEVAATVFKPFSTMKKEGTGFGLAIVKQIVDAHGGHVEMERRGDTTRFSMFFPSMA
jgi:two-component system, NtrC family, sensor kinase